MINPIKISDIDIESFVARDSELNYLSKILSQNNSVLISGMAGVGKTTIAKMYIQVNKEKYTNFVWYNFYEFNNPSKDINRLVIDLNNEKTNGIVVIDDIDGEWLELLSNIVFSINNNWHVILISRYTCENLHLPSITIGGLSKKEAHDLIKILLPEHYKKAINEFEENKLLDFVQSHPLAISLLINVYKQSSSLTISEFLKRVASNQELLFDIAKKPVEIFLDTDNETQINSIYKNVVNYLTNKNLEIEKSPPSEKGSWFKRIFVKTKEAISSDGVKEKVGEVNYSVKLHAITKQQSEVDKNQAEAVSNIINSIKDVPNAAIKIGSILIVKTTSSEIPSIAVKNLSIKEMVELENKPSLLKSPKELLEALDYQEDIQKKG